MLGGSVSNPLEKSENDLLLQLGDKFYEVCEAGAQSGKTLWIGIERGENDKWVVSKQFRRSGRSGRLLELNLEKPFGLELKEERTVNGR